MPETRLVSSEAVGPETIAVTLETPPDFEGAPGQFVQLTADIDGEEQSSYYTISSPTVGETMEVTVAVGADGSVGAWLADLEPGATVPVTGPYGDIAYEGDDDVLVLAGGPGIGPGIGIGERARPDHAVTVVYQAETYVHRDRLDDLEAAGATVEYVGAEASIDPALLADDLDRAVYVFGFNEFVASATDAIEAAGGDASGANVEGFGPA